MALKNKAVSNKTSNSEYFELLEKNDINSFV